jgi:hypothetical protein
MRDLPFWCVIALLEINVKNRWNESILAASDFGKSGDPSP